jgi:hypothetical protein
MSERNLLSEEHRSHSIPLEAKSATQHLYADDIEYRYMTGLIAGEGLRGAGNGAARAGALQQAQRTYGNRAVQRYVSGPGRQDGRVMVAREEDSWWDRARGYAGDAANAVGSSTAGVMGLADAALHGLRSPLLPELARSPIGSMVAGLPGARHLAALSSEFSFAGNLSKGLGMANNIAGGLGVGLGAYNFATATNNSDRVQAGADTIASGIGFLGPVGRAFSGGYAAGQLLDKGVDWIGDKVSGNEDADHSISGAGADLLMDTIGPGPGLWLADTFGL